MLRMFSFFSGSISYNTLREFWKLQLITDNLELSGFHGFLFQNSLITSLNTAAKHTKVGKKQWMLHQLISRLQHFEIRRYASDSIN